MSATAEAVTPARVKSRFEEFGLGLTRQGLLASYVVGLADGVSLTLHRAADGKIATVEMSGSTEVFFLELNGTYRTHATAYESTDKWEVIEGYLGTAASFMRKDYVEEILEQRGRAISRSIRIGDQVISARSNLSDKLRRVLGGNRVIRRP
jgi:hypothetical protein